MNLLFVFWGLLLVFKIVLNMFIPLAPDEAYYWVWSHYPSWSYYDHPGMVAWLFWIGKWFSFLPHGERIPAILLNHCTLLIWFQILKNVWNEDYTWKWLFLFVASPFLGLGSLLVTPDLPLLFFWALALYFFIKLLTHDHWFFAMMTGFALGLGFCSKYVIVLFVPSALVFLFAERKFRKIRPSHLAIVVIAGLVGSFPVLYWNSQNDWISFLFQLKHGLGREEWKPHWSSDYVIGQLLIFFPSLLFLFGKGYRFEKLRVFFWFALVPWLTFLVTSFRGAVQANWPIISYAPALILVIAAHRTYTHLKAVIALWIALNLTLLALWIYPISDKVPPKLQEVHQLRAIIPDISSYEPLYAGSYQIASILWYYSRTPIFKIRGMSRTDFFDGLEDSVPADATFYLVREDNEPLPDWLLARQPRIDIIKQFERYDLLKVSP